MCPRPEWRQQSWRIGLRLAGNPELLEGRIDVEVVDMTAEPGGAGLVDDAIDREVFLGKRAPDRQEQAGREIDGLRDQLALVGGVFLLPQRAEPWTW
jgi:hypothetical protein